MHRMFELFAITWYFFVRRFPVHGRARASGADVLKVVLPQVAEAGKWAFFDFTRPGIQQTDGRNSAPEETAAAAFEMICMPSPLPIRYVSELSADQRNRSAP